MDKTIEKKIAKIVKSELDTKNYEDTAWLKAFREAGGDDKQSRASYVEIRTADLNDEYYEESNRLEEKKLREEEKKQNRKDRISRAGEYKKQRRSERQSRYEYKYTAKPKRIYRDTSSLSFVEKCKYFVNGYYSLSFSFWMVGILISIILSLPIVYLTLSADLDNMGEMASLLGILYLIFNFVFQIFVILGMWRSAGFYIEENKPPFWGYVVRVFSVFAVLGLFLRVISLFAQ